MTEFTADDNGNTIAWRLGRVEASLDVLQENKADIADVKRLEAGQDKLTAAVNRLVALAFAATLSGATAAVLLAIQLTQ